MKLEERAQQVWQVLIGAAHHRQTLTYKMLSDAIGMGGARFLGRPLDLVQAYCQQAGLPPLTAIVVGQRSGKPSEGFTAVEDVDAEREGVFACAWYRQVPPQASDFS